jgi:hypothetical protein
MTDPNAQADLAIKTIQQAALVLNNFRPIPMVIGEETFQIRKLSRRAFRDGLDRFTTAIAIFMQGIELDNPEVLQRLATEVPGLADFLIAEGTDASAEQLDKLPSWDAEMGLAVAVIVANFVHNQAVRTFFAIGQSAAVSVTLENAPVPAGGSPNGESPAVDSQPS